jgi:hypothetical protein
MRGSSPPMNIGYKFIRAPQHPLATSWGTVLEHRKVLYDRIGGGPHPCHWCGKRLTWQVRQGGGGSTLTVDHLDNNPANNRLTNLVPCCTRCNITRNRANLVADTEVFIDSPGRRGRVRAVELTCPECGDPFLVPKAEAHRRRFCSPACMYRGRPKPAGRPPKQRP